MMKNDEEGKKIQDIQEMYKTLVMLKELIFEFDEKFIKKKKDKNIVDFSDVEHYALQILVKEKEDGTHERSDIAKKYMSKFIPKYFYRIF